VALLAVGLPAPALGFCNPRSTGLSFRPGRRSTMKTAALFAELDPRHADHITDNCDYRTICPVIDLDLQVHAFRSG
jgi:hypothetical protein